MNKDKKDKKENWTIMSYDDFSASTPEITQEGIQEEAEVEDLPEEENLSEDALPIPLTQELDSLPLDRLGVKLVGDIIKAESVEDLKNLTKAFEINQAKKNALRIIKLSNLLDLVNDQAIERFITDPERITHKELLGYMQVVQTQIEKSQQIVDKIDTAPMIQINQQTNEINVNVGDDIINQESKERVIDAVKALLKTVQASQQVATQVIEIEEQNEDEEKKG